MKKNRISRLTQAGVAVLAAWAAGWILFACTGHEAELDTTTSSTNNDGGVDEGNGDDGDTGLDAADADAGDSEAGPEPTCDLSAPFQDVTQILASYSANFAADPSLTSDEKTIVFSMNDGNGKHLYMATRDSTSEGFGYARLVDGLYVGGTIAGANWDDIQGQISPLGDTLVFASTRPDTAAEGHDHIFRARRTDNTYAVEATPLYTEPEDTTKTWNEFHPFLTNGGGELFFHSYRDINQSRIFRSAADENGDFLSASSISPYYNDTNKVSDGYPVVSRDGLTMYFSSDYPGPASEAYSHIFVMTRTSVVGQFGTPNSVNGIRDQLPTSVREDPGWISDDGCRLYFTSYPTDDPNPTLWVASKSSK
ncbi:MAG: hypothetical protein FWD73_12680 [Polyangiaceae bacterium]|nr:hypothetical protein [Polyangiaceae bacterium]